MDEGMVHYNISLPRLYIEWDGAPQNEQITCEGKIFYIKLLLLLLLKFNRFSYFE